MRPPPLVSATRGSPRHSVRSSGRTVRRFYAEVRVMRGERDGVSRRVRCAVAALSLACVAAACSSGSDSDATSTSSSAPTTSVPTATTSVDRTTTTAATTSSTSTSTTVDPAAQAVAAVRAAIDLAQTTFSGCLVAMPSCDPSTLSVARAGDLLARNVARINEWNAAGYTVRNRDQFRYVVEEVTLAPSGTQATALVCIADGSDLVQPGAGPGGADVISRRLVHVRSRRRGICDSTPTASGVRTTRRPWVPPNRETYVPVG